jgi:hypothetical protein
MSLGQVHRTPSLRERKPPARYRAARRAGCDLGSARRTVLSIVAVTVRAWPLIVGRKAGAEVEPRSQQRSVVLALCVRGRLLGPRLELIRQRLLDTPRR